MFKHWFSNFEEEVHDFEKGNVMIANRKCRCDTQAAFWQAGSSRVSRGWISRHLKG